MSGRTAIGASQGRIGMKARRNVSERSARARSRPSQQAAVSVMVSPTRRSGSHRECARRVLRIETDALVALRDRLDASFDRAVELLARCGGKVAAVGVGTSGIRCRKIAATLAGPGSPALVLPAAESTHGDSGMRTHGDAELAVADSG